MILAAVFAYQFCQCRCQFGMLTFQFGRSRIEAVQSGLAQSQAVGFRLRRRFGDHPDHHFPYSVMQCLQLGQHGRQDHFQTRSSHIVGSQQNQSSVFNTGRLKMFRRPEVLHRPKIEKREGYRYCSSKGEEKGVQYTPLRPLSTNLSFNQVLQVLNK